MDFIDINNDGEIEYRYYATELSTFFKTVIKLDTLMKSTNQQSQQKRDRTKNAEKRLIDS